MPRRPSIGRHGGDDNLLAWTVFIVFLALFAIVCWIGSFYVFGHPENAFSYRVLRSVGKIDPPKRFELTAAPRGQFLDADELLERYGGQSPEELEEANRLLLRNYLRNYRQIKDRIPYVIGSFHVMAVFRLGPSNFFPEGIVALARSTQNPAVLLELIFPAEEKNIGNLERLLQTGLDFTLARTLDLSAVIHVQRTPEGGLQLTAVPLLYGSYASTDETGTFSLEPPGDLKVSAGLPVLNQAAVGKAGEHYARYLQRAGLGESAGAAPSLMRVQKPEAANPEAVPGPAPTPAPAAATAAVPATETIDGVPVAKAIPVAAAGEDVPVARALPVDAALPSPPPAAAALQPFITAPAPTPPAATAGGAGHWPLYDPGRMPRGRLLDAGAARSLAGRGATTEPVYLSGEFNVASSGGGRAVLSGRRAPRNVRIIADFPAGAPSPVRGETLRRDSSRPFRIDRVEQGPDGFINVYVREITRP
jgi:hypothetical protein